MLDEKNKKKLKTQQCRSNHKSSKVKPNMTMKIIHRQNYQKQMGLIMLMKSIHGLEAIQHFIKTKYRKTFFTKTYHLKR